MNIKKYLLLLIFINISFFNSSRPMNAIVDEHGMIITPDKNELILGHIGDIIVNLPKHDIQLMDKLQIATSCGHMAFGLLASYTGMKLLYKLLKPKKSISEVTENPASALASLSLICGGLYCIHEPLATYAHYLIKHYKS